MKLAIPALDAHDELEDFVPRASSPITPAEAKRVVDRGASFPSREISPDAQLNLKGPRHILERFKAICKNDRRAYYDMLEILMDCYDAQS
ncbi:hypothetical protein [Ruegeria sp.]|uniref:hypothetical protein n=1 Tax=Ruegeria sp. TaxID=1879320 RepID=UPI003B0051DC